MSASTSSIRRLLLVSPVALYAAAIPLVANLQVDRQIRLAIYQNRSYAILAAVIGAVIGLLVLAPATVGRALRSPWYRQLLVASALFPVAFAIFSVIKGMVSVPVIGLYAVWSIAVFFVAPLLFNSVDRLRALVVALLVANVFALLLGYYLFSTRAPITMFEGRESFGYSNPNTYAQILQVIGCTSAYLFVSRGKNRGILFAVLVLVSIVLVVVAAESRNVISFFLGAAGAYALLRAGRGKRVAIPLLIAASSMIAVVVLSHSDVTEVDRFSSGRIALWKRTIDDVFVRDDNGTAVLIGRTRELSSRVGTRTYSDIVESATFEKYRVDNFYLELVVEAGLIGALIFLWPYVLLAIMLWRLRRSRPGRTPANLALALLIGLAVQGSFAPLIPSFNSPVGFMFALVAVPLLQVGLREAATDAPSSLGEGRR